MKNENLPVKIDCYAFKKGKGSLGEVTKHHVGYILCPVKIIPVAPLAKAFQIQSKPRWMKFIGLTKEWRPYKPELLMSIIITGADYEAGNKDDVLESHGLESVDSVVIEENPLPSMMTSQKGIFIRLLRHEGVVQVGDIDTNCDVFSVKMLMRNFRSLENVRVNFLSKTVENKLFFSFVADTSFHS